MSHAEKNRDNLSLKLKREIIDPLGSKNKGSASNIIQNTKIGS